MNPPSLLYVLFIIFCTICSQARGATNQNVGAAAVATSTPATSTSTHSDSLKDQSGSPTTEPIHPTTNGSDHSSSSSHTTNSTKTKQHHPPDSSLSSRIHPFPHPPDVPFHPHQQTGEKPVLIVLEVLGGTLAFFLAFAAARCLISYRRTPHRDRVAAYIHRHQLQREMEELEEQQQAALFRRTSLYEPPPPPYLRPPDYHGEESSTPTSAFPASFPSQSINPEPPPQHPRSRPDSPAQPLTR